MRNIKNLMTSIVNRITSSYKTDLNHDFKRLDLLKWNTKFYWIPRQCGTRLFIHSKVNFNYQYYKDRIEYNFNRNPYIDQEKDISFNKNNCFVYLAFKQDLEEGNTPYYFNGITFKRCVNSNKAILEHINTLLTEEHNDLIKRATEEVKQAYLLKS